MVGPYHEGELEIQRRAGVEPRAKELAQSIGSQLSADAAVFLRPLRMLLIAGRDRDGAVWCVPLTGPAGFVRPLDARTLQIAASEPARHPLLEALNAPRPVPLGLLAVDFATRRRVRLNGRGGILDGSLYVRVEQAYVNCKKHLARRLPPDGDRAAAAAIGPARTALEQADRRLIAGADTFFVGSAAATGADASHRGGRPGVVTVLTETCLAWPDYTGNAMFNTLGNLALDPRCGLAFLDWDAGDALTLTGSATVDWSPQRAVGVPGADRIVDFTVRRALTIRSALPAGWQLESYSPSSPLPAAVAPA
jgi:predicted pyridoxine 5'-phosphate oxidase superfamily flavin-nucleotide-binding protein